MKFLPMAVVGIIILAVAGGAYFAGKSGLRLTTSTSTPAATIIPTIAPTSSPSVVSKKTVSAGGSLVFPKYTIEVPDTWTAKPEHDSKADMDRLTLSRDGYEIIIYQAATGGAVCLYPEDPDFEGPSSRYADYTVIGTKEGRIFRRGGESGGTGYTLCSRQKDGSFIQPTFFGHISYKVPVATDPSILVEMDVIIGSIGAQ